MDERRLARALVARKGKFGLFIMDTGGQDTCSASTLNPAITLLDKNEISHSRIDLNAETSIDDLISQMQDLQKKGFDAIHLIGMQEWLKQCEPYNNGTATRADILNILRENLFKIPTLALIWLSPKGIEEFSGMMDLWSWREGVYILQNKETVPSPRPPRP